MIRRSWTCFLLTLSVATTSPAALVSVSNPFDQFGKVPNGTCANPQASVCGAAAMINSFEFLRRTNMALLGNTSIIPDWNNDKMITMSDLETSRDRLGIDGWKSPGGEDRKGYYKRDGTVRSDWEAKVDWLNDFAPGKIIFDGQIDANRKDLGITEKDVSKWKNGGVLENKQPEWAFLFNQIKGKEDVEIAFRGGNTFHAVTVTGLDFDDKNGNKMFDAGEDRFLRYLDPNDVKGEKKAQLSMGGGGQLQFKYGVDTVDILYAFSESPVPEPSTILSGTLGLIVTAGLARKNRKYGGNSRNQQC